MLPAASLADRFEHPRLRQKTYAAMNSKAERLPFLTFWTRLQNELESLQETKGYHCGKAKKWSQDKDYFGEEFKFLFKGGSVIYCQTGTTDKLRSVSRVEFEKVYAVWKKYCSGEVPRSHITQDLGVQNSSWIIPLLKKYEHLMR